MLVRHFFAIALAAPVLAGATSATAQQLPYEDPAGPDAEVVYDGETVVAPPAVPPVPPLPPLPPAPPEVRSAHRAHPAVIPAPPVYAAAPPTVYAAGPGFSHPYPHPHSRADMHPFPGHAYLPYGHAYPSVAYVPVLVAVPQRAVVRETVTEEWVPGPAPARPRTEREIEHAPAPDKRIKMHSGR